MTKKLGNLDVKTRKIIQTKFADTPQSVAKAFALQDAERAKSLSSRRRATASRGSSHTALSLTGGGEETRKFFPDFPIGAFEGEPRLVWIKPDVFRHEPNPDCPFRFVRDTGEVIEPGLMFTDGGSIPRALWFLKNLSPWSYAPAFLIHDWLFDMHHCGRTDKSFAEVRDILMEGVRTLMESKLCPLDRLAFDAIYAGVDSPVAHQVWDKPGCHLP